MTLVEIYAAFGSPALVVALAYGLMLYDRRQRTLNLAADKAAPARAQRPVREVPAE